MATREEIIAKVADIANTQKYEKTFDLTRSFVAEAGKMESFTIPLTTEGPFVQESYNILVTHNSTVQYDPDDPSLTREYIYSFESGEEYNEIESEREDFDMEDDEDWEDE